MTTLTDRCELADLSVHELHDLALDRAIELGISGSCGICSAPCQLRTRERRSSKTS